MAESVLVIVPYTGSTVNPTPPTTPTLSVTVRDNDSANNFAHPKFYTGGTSAATMTSDDIYAMLVAAKCTNISATGSTWNFTKSNGVPVTGQTITPVQQIKITLNRTANTYVDVGATLAKGSYDAIKVGTSFETADHTYTAADEGKVFESGYYEVTAGPVTISATNTNTASATAAIKTGTDKYIKDSGTITLTITTADAALVGGTNGVKATASIASNGTVDSQTPAATEQFMEANAASGTSKDLSVTIKNVTGKITINVTLEDLNT